MQNINMNKIMNKIKRITKKNATTIKEMGNIIIKMGKNEEKNPTK